MGSAQWSGMKLAVYLSGIPPKAKNQAKRELLTRFAQGAKKAGDEVWLVNQSQTIDCDVAVIQGWIGMKSAPHLELRKRVITEVTKRKHVLVIDSNLFGFLNPADKDRYLRYSLDGIFPDTGHYFDQVPDPSRWPTIKTAYDFKERTWTTQGSHVLVTLQRNGGWSMGDIPVQTWLDKTIPLIRKHSSRPIIVRPHPGNLAIVPSLKLPPVGKISWSANQDIRDDLNHAWATVTYNSSPGVASLLWGVPAFVTDPQPTRSQAFPWASSDLTKIEQPLRPDRQDFYTRLAQCHWSLNELDTGEAWQFMRQRLPNIVCQ